MTRRLPTDRRGLALLMVLVLLAVLSSVLTLQTRAALQSSMATKIRARVVQQAWAVRSVAAAVAPHTGRLLRQSEARPVRRRGRPARARWSGSVRLGSVAVAVAVTDEQAKVNLHTQRPADVAAALASLMGPVAAARRVRLRPLPAVVSNETPPPRTAEESSEDAGGVLPREAPGPDSGDAAPGILIEPGRFAGYGQVLDRPRLQELVAPGAGGSLVQNWTLWGPGTLHFATATPEALRWVLSSELPPGAVDQLLRARLRGGSLKDAIAAAEQAAAGVSESDAGFDDNPDLDPAPGAGLELGPFSDVDASYAYDTDGSPAPTESATPDWRRWLSDRSQTHGIWLVASAPADLGGDRVSGFYVVESGRKVLRVHQW